MSTTTNTIGKKVKMNLVGLDGNSFSLMGHFQQNGRRQGWSKDEINQVLTKCMSGDYDNLIRVLIDHTEEVEEFEDSW